MPKQTSIRHMASWSARITSLLDRGLRVLSWFFPLPRGPLLEMQVNLDHWVSHRTFCIQKSQRHTSLDDCRFLPVPESAELPQFAGAQIERIRTEQSGARGGHFHVRKPKGGGSANG